MSLQGHLSKQQHLHQQDPTLYERKTRRWGSKRKPTSKAGKQKKGNSQKHKKKNQSKPQWHSEDKKTKINK